jgi:hypothetical protein
LRHRVTGVDHEVHKHLLDLAGVGLYWPQIGSRRSLEHNILTDEAAQQLNDLKNEIVLNIDPAGDQIAGCSIAQYPRHRRVSA